MDCDRDRALDPAGQAIRRTPTGIAPTLLPMASLVLLLVAPPLSAAEVLFDARQGDGANALSISPVSVGGSSDDGRRSADDFVSLGTTTIHRVRVWLQVPETNGDLSGPFHYKISRNQVSLPGALVDEGLAEIDLILPNGPNRAIVEFDLERPLRLAPNVYWLDLRLDESLNVSWEETDFSGLDNPEPFFTFEGVSSEPDGSGGSIRGHLAFQVLGVRNESDLIMLDGVFGPRTVTLDRRTGFEWLDLTLSRQQSFVEVSGQLDVGGTFEGWRFANVSEVTGLFESAQIPNIGGHTSANHLPTMNLARVVGNISQSSGSGCSVSMSALTADSNGSLVVRSRLAGSCGNGDGRAEPNGGLVSPDLSEVQMGSWLVREADRPMVKISTDLFGAFGEPFVVPVEIVNHQADIASVAFSVDLDPCLGFDPTDTDLDGIPDAVSTPLGDPFGLMSFYDPGDADGELDFLVSSSPVAAIPEGTLVEIRLEPLCAPPVPGGSLIEIPFSVAPAASFGSTSGEDVPGLAFGGAVLVFGGDRGDCNDDGLLGAGDTAALPIELLDGDGSDVLDVPGGTFPGSPIGCDANADRTVDIGDLSCIARLVFDLGCDLGRVSGAPTLWIPDRVPVDKGAPTISLPLTFSPNGSEATLIAASLEIDLDHFEFEALETVAPGVEVITQELTVEADTMVLDLILGSTVPDGPPIPSGTVAVLSMEVVSPPEHGPFLRPGGERRPSAGDGRGRGGLASVHVGIFSDGFESGDTRAWSR